MGEVGATANGNVLRAQVDDLRERVVSLELDSGLDRNNLSNLREAVGVISNDIAWIKSAVRWWGGILATIVAALLVTGIVWIAGKVASMMTLAVQ
jgi:hypothetical protein